MSDESFRLKRSPIIEAVLDIDCDLPPSTDLVALETETRRLFGDTYPKYRVQWSEEHQIRHQKEAPIDVSITRRVAALQCLSEDERQLIQVRAEGFSFNRLAPYSTLDDYLLEIERTWGKFVNLALPVVIRKLSLRYINRILLPLDEGKVELDSFLKVGPRLPDESRMQFTGFLNKHSTVEVATGNQVNMILVLQPREGDQLPLIFDIEAWKPVRIMPHQWTQIEATIQSLRSLAKHIFRESLTESCLNLYQH